MKKNLAILMALFLVGSITLSSYTTQNFESPEQFAEKVFASIKAKNIENYKQLFIQKAEYEAAIDKSYLPDIKKEKEKAAIEDQLKTLLIDLKPSYDKIVQQGEDLGITWSEASFKDAEYDLFKKDNIYTCYISIVFEYKDLHYTIKLGKSYLCNGVWKMKNTPSFIK